jgi:hypothetical protein
MIAHMSVVAYVGAEGGEVFILDDLQHVLMKGHKDSCGANGSSFISVQIEHTYV